MKRLFVLAGIVAALGIVIALLAGGIVIASIVLKRDKKDRIPTASATSEPELPVEPAKPPPPPPDPRIEIVQPAVDRGVAFIKQNTPGLSAHRPAYAGLNGLALLECGVSPDDPAIVSIADIIRKQAPAMNQTYDLASSLFFLNRLDEIRPLSEQDSKLARTLVLRIIAGQITTGLWEYNGVILPPDGEQALLTSLEQGTYKPSRQIRPSMSCTQFAMLAVWGSRKHGVPVRPPLLALAEYFHANQHADGHWNYPGFSLTATSTCAGLIALALERVLLEDDEFATKKLQPISGKKRADVEKAFEYVGKTIGRKKGDPGGGAATGYGGTIFDADAYGDLYFLWTLERVGVIYSCDIIAGKDWYDWGYPIVLRTQAKEGSWDDRHGTLIDTPLALLFLKRANIARDLTSKLMRIQKLN